MLRISCCVFLVCGLLISTAAPLHAQEPHQAGLVVQFGDGTVVTRCIGFSEDEISGEEILHRSGLTVLFDYTSGLGTRVCKIEADGCEVPAEDCWCQCQGIPCRYWTYFYVVDGAWHYAGLGSSNRTVHDGDVEGWVWGDGRTSPPLLTPDDICGTGAEVKPLTPAPSPVPPEPNATANVVQLLPTPPDSNPPPDERTTVTATGSPINLSNYAAFAIIVLALGGLGLFLYKRMA